MRFHPDDSADYRIRDMPWLLARCEQRQLSRPDLNFKQVLHYEGSVTLGGDLVSPFGATSGSCLLVEGDLEVPGEIRVSADALWVLGAVRCNQFVANNPMFVGTGRLQARRFAAFAALGGASLKIESLDTPLLLRSSAESAAVDASFDKSRIEHVVNREAAPEDMGDVPLLDFLRARSPAFLAALRAGSDPWALIGAAKLSPRLQKLAAAVRGGATLEWTELSGRSAARITHADGARQIATLTLEEEEALRADLQRT